MTIGRLNPPPASVEAKRRIVVRAGLRIAVVAAIDFLLLRICVPDLINRHQDLALAAALLCLLGAAAATVWLAFQLWAERAHWVRTRPWLAARGPGVEK